MGRKRAIEKVVDKKYKWLVKWKYCPNNPTTWEPLANLQGCQKLLAEFEARWRPGMHVQVDPKPPKKLMKKCSDEWNEKGIYEVEKILDKKLFYLVKWRGHGASKNEWLSEQHLLQHKNLIRDFENRRERSKSEKL